MEGLNQRHPVDVDRACDNALRSAMATLRPLRTAAAPDFPATLARTERLRAPHIHARSRRALLAAAALAIVLLVAREARARAQVQADVELARAIAPLLRWEAPSDALLDGRADLPTVLLPGTWTTTPFEMRLQ